MKLSVHTTLRNGLGKWRGSPRSVQVGNLPQPGSAPVAPGEPPYALQAVSDDTLSDAAAWMKQWPEARGLTHLLPALLMCRSCWADVDSIYLFSDGIIDDSAAVMGMLQEIAAAGREATSRRPTSTHTRPRPAGERVERMPPVHAVGFFASERSARGPAFMQEIAIATGGSYQEYDPEKQQVYVDGELQPFDAARETGEDRAEREWVEGRLAAERWGAAREGRKEDLETTMGRVRAAWHMERLLPARDRGDEGREEHEAARAAVAERNAARVETARAAQVAEARAAWQAAAVEAAREAVAAAAAHEARRRAWLTEAEERRAAVAAAAASAASDAAAAAVSAEAAAVAAAAAAAATPGSGAAAKAAGRRRSRSRSRTRSGSITASRSAVRAANRAARKAEKAAKRAHEAAARAEARCAGPFVSLVEAAEKAQKQLAEEAARPPKPPSERKILQRKYEAELKAVQNHNKRCALHRQLCRWHSCHSGAAWGCPNMGACQRPSVPSGSYKRVKGRSHTVEERLIMHPHKPHATSQPSRLSHTYRPSTHSPHNRHSHQPRPIHMSHHGISTGTAKPAS